MNRQPAIHQLKTEAAHFEATERGDKRAEIRKNDRGYLPGDFLALAKWIPSDAPGIEGHYTGEVILVQITHALHGPQHGIAEGYVMLSHEALARTRNRNDAHNLETAVR